MGKKHAKPAASSTTNLPTPVISALSPEEIKKRKLIKGGASAPYTYASTIFGNVPAPGTTSTLGGS